MFNTKQLFIDYNNARDEDKINIRNKILEECYPFICQQAKYMRKKMNGRVDFYELVSYGFEGMLRAFNKFNTNKGYNFITYSWQFVIGAMKDHIRSENRHKILQLNSNDLIYYTKLPDMDLLSLDTFNYICNYLTRHEKLIVRLYYYMGFEINEICKIMGYSGTYVNITKNKALRKIKFYLKRSLSND
jgi:RNA polymerase sigma factor (sigma-70 family)